MSRVASNGARKVDSVGNPTRTGIYRTSAPEASYSTLFGGVVQQARHAAHEQRSWSDEEECARDNTILSLSTLAETCRRSDEIGGEESRASKGGTTERGGIKGRGEWMKAIPLTWLFAKQSSGSWH